MSVRSFSDDLCSTFLQSRIIARPNRLMVLVFIDVLNCRIARYLEKQVKENGAPCSSNRPLDLSLEIENYISQI